MLQNFDLCLDKLVHSSISNDNSSNEDFSKAYCKIKRIILLSLFSPLVDYIPITVGSKLHGRNPEGQNASASVRGIDAK